MFAWEKGDDWLVDQERERPLDLEKRRLVVAALALSVELGSTVMDIVELVDWARANKN